MKGSVRAMAMELGLLVVMSSVVATTAQAQGTAAATKSMFAPGYTDVGPTIGIGGIGAAGLAFGARLERALMRLPELGNGVLGVQASFDYWRFTDLQGVMHVNTSAIGVGVNYHFAIAGKPKLDPFLGVGLGNMHVSAKYDDGYASYAGSYPRGTYFIGRAGVRYFYSDHVALYGEVGAGASTINAGVTFGLGGRK